MHLLGGIEAKLLAAAVAVMSVATGLPRVQCVCPDGRVHLFWGGPSPPCCCAAHTCCSGDAEPSGQAPACCARVTQGTPPGDGHAQACGLCACERTVVSAPPQLLPQDDGGSPRGEPATALAWGLSASLPEQPVRRTLFRSEARRGPPDLVIVLCHFTC